MKTYVFSVVVEPDEDRWSAHCPALAHLGAATWGDTEDEALLHIQEVARMIVAELLEEGEPIPADVRVSPEPLGAIHPPFFCSLASSLDGARHNPGRQGERWGPRIPLRSIRATFLPKPAPVLNVPAEVQCGLGTAPHSDGQCVSRALRSRQWCGSRYQSRLRQSLLVHIPVRIADTPSLGSLTSPP